MARAPGRRRPQRHPAPDGLAPFGRKVVVALVPAFLQDHPGLQIDLLVSNSIVDIVAQGLDLAIPIALLRENTLVARRLADNPVASTRRRTERTRPKMANATWAPSAGAIWLGMMTDMGLSDIHLASRDAARRFAASRSICHAGHGTVGIRPMDGQGSGARSVRLPGE